VAGLCPGGVGLGRFDAVGLQLGAEGSVLSIIWEFWTAA